MDGTTTFGGNTEPISTLEAPIYTMLEETKSRKISITSEERAMKYIERIRSNKNKQMKHNCWKVTMMKEYQPEKNNTRKKRWQKYSTKSMEKTRSQGNNTIRIILD